MNAHFSVQRGGLALAAMLSVAQGCSSSPDGMLHGPPGGTTAGGTGTSGDNTATGNTGIGPGNGGTSGATSATTGQGTGSGQDAGQDAGPQVVENCIEVSRQPKLAKPVDIVWVIDNSPSMDNEAAAVATNVLSFADALAQSELDYHLIVVSREGFVPEYAQLAQTLPADRFLFVNEDVQSPEPLDDLLSAYSRYQGILRPSAALHFVAVTDDEARCVGAAAECPCRGPLDWQCLLFPPDEATLWTPEQIAAAGRDQFMNDMGALLGGREFLFHSVVAPDAACAGDLGNPGWTYHALSETTGGDIFSICGGDWTGLFEQLGSAVDESAKVSCAVPVPEPPNGLALNPEQVTIDLSIDGTATPLPRVANAEQCGAGGWYYDRPLLPQLIELCPAECETLQTQATAKLGVTLSCGSNACAGVSTKAEVFATPVDVVWVVDSSSTMEDELSRIGSNLQMFADKMEGTGLDFRVFVVRSPDAGFEVPADDRFFPVDVAIGARDALHQSLAQIGAISENMRADAVTHFVFVSDNESAPMAGGDEPAAPEEAEATAQWFAGALSAAGALGKEFIAHAIASEAPACAGANNQATAPGLVYYELAAQTGGTTFSICEDDWTPLFDQLSTAVFSSTPVACSFDLPEPPKGQVFSTDKVNVRFGFQGAAQATIVGYTGGADACTAGGWYYDDADNPSRIELCPSTCDEIQGSTRPAIDIELGCETEIVDIL